MPQKIDMLLVRLRVRPGEPVAPFTVEPFQANRYDADLAGERYVHDHFWILNPLKATKPERRTVYPRQFASALGKPVVFPTHDEYLVYMLARGRRVDKVDAFITMRAALIEHLETDVTTRELEIKTEQQELAQWNTVKSRLEQAPTPHILPKHIQRDARYLQESIDDARAGESDLSIYEADVETLKAALALVNAIIDGNGKLHARPDPDSPLGELFQRMNPDALAFLGTP